MENNPMNTTKVIPVEIGNPKKKEKLSCQLCFAENKIKKLITCPVNNNCNYIVCKKCIGKEKQRIIEINENEKHMICPACRKKWPFNDSVQAEQYRMFGATQCPCYCVCIHNDDNWCQCWCVKNMDHWLYRNNFIQYLIIKKNVCMNNIKFIKQKFFEQKEFILFLQITLLTISFRTIFDIYACAIFGVERDTYEHDWCMPFITPWFIILSVLGLIFFFLSIFAIIFALSIIASFLQCYCDHTNNYYD